MTSLVARRRVSPVEKLLPWPNLLRSRPRVDSPVSLVEAAMTPRDQKKERRPSPEGRLRVMNPHAAGIDVHANVHWVAVPAADAPAPPPDHPPILPPNVRSFGACTAALIALANWLTTCHVRTVVMESTGIYWIPLFELLEARGFEVLLVEPRQSRHAPGRPKSDV